MKRLLPLIALVWAVNSACTSSECETKQDCPSGMQCTDGVCEMITGTCPNPPCGGLDVGPRDAFVPDVGPDAGVDGGDGGDAGDGGDGGDGGGGDGGGGDGGDAGDAGDGGPDGSLTPFGEVWVGEILATTTEVRAFADFQDRRSATYEVYTNEYAPAGATCVIESIQLVSGQPTPIEATDVTVDMNNGQILTYISTGMGHYAPQFAPNPGIFGATLTPVDFTINGGTQAGELDDAMATSDAPYAVNPIAPLPVGNPIMLTQQIQWQPATAQTMRRTVIEVYDVDRSTRLTCRIDPDSGMFTLPADAVADFMAHDATAPLTVELRYEFVVARPVDIIPGTAQTVVLFHTARGVQWTVQ